MNVHSFEHVPFEGLAGIGPWLKRRGHSVSRTRFWLNEPVPDIGSIDLLVIMGGPMGVNDELIHPWLNPEKRLIEEALRRGKRILGICLGAQMIADVLGSRVYPQKNREIGWFPVSLTTQGVSSRWFHSITSPFVPFHWHGDTFDLPAGAVHLARSEACDNQAFSYGEHILALQFHLDSTIESINQLIQHCPDDLAPGPFVQSVAEIRNPPSEIFGQLSQSLAIVLDAIGREVAVQ